MPIHRRALEDAVGPLGPVALGVGVLDPQDEGAAVLAGEDEVVEGRAGAADVEVARRRRGEAHAHGPIGHPGRLPKGRPDPTAVEAARHGSDRPCAPTARPPALTVSSRRAARVTGV